MNSEKFQVVGDPKSGVSRSGGEGENGVEKRLRAVETLLARIDERTENFATKADIQGIETLIATRESSLLRWLIGIISVSLISLAVALIRTFISN